MRSPDQSQIIGYPWQTGEQLYTFGYGLSYAMFSYDNLSVPEQSPAGSDVKVAQTGMIDISVSGGQCGAQTARLPIVQR